MGSGMAGSERKALRIEIKAARTSLAAADLWTVAGRHFASKNQSTNTRDGESGFSRRLMFAQIMFPSKSARDLCWIEPLYS